MIKCRTKLDKKTICFLYELQTGRVRIHNLDISFASTLSSMPQKIFKENFISNRYNTINIKPCQESSISGKIMAGVMA